MLFFMINSSVKNNVIVRFINLAITLYRAIRFQWSLGGRLLNTEQLLVKFIQHFVNLKNIFVIPRLDEVFYNYIKF